MQKFTLDGAVANKYQRKQLFITIPLALVGAGIAMYFADSGTLDWSVLMISFPLTLIVIGISAARGWKRTRALVDSYTLVFEDNRITREQKNTPTVSLSFMEIREVSRTPKGSFIIKGERRTDVICIPCYVHDYPEVERLVGNLGSVPVKPAKSLSRKLRWPIVILFLAMCIVVFTGGNKVLVGVCGLCVAAGGVWGFYQQVTSKNIPVDMRRRSWVFLLFVGAVLYVTFTKLSS